MLELEFMRLALATGAIVGVLAPAVGFFLVQRQLSLIGDGIGHVAFAGVAAGYLLGLPPVATALVASIGGAGAIEWLRSRRHAAGDQALALVFYTGIAAGVVLVSLAGALDVDLFGFLFGSILTTTRGDLALVATLGLAGLGLLALLYRALAAVALDEEGARVAGVPVARLNVVLAVLAATTVALSMRIVGVVRRPAARRHDRADRRRRRAPLRRRPRAPTRLRDCGGGALVPRERVVARPRPADGGGGDRRGHALARRPAGRAGGGIAEP
jgi:zinc transport system permease protein